MLSRSAVTPRWTMALWGVAVLTFALGLVLPLVQIKRFLVFSDIHSLASIILSLFIDGQLLVAVALLVFSVIFPAAKLLVLGQVIWTCNDRRTAAARHHRWLTRLAALSKWSMLDVLVLALVVFSAKASGFATAITLPGAWFFALSVILTGAATAALGRPASHRDDD